MPLLNLFYLKITQKITKRHGMDKVEENLKEFQAVFFRKLRNEWRDEDGKKANSFFKRGLFVAVAVLRSHGPYQ